LSRKESKTKGKADDSQFIRYHEAATVGVVTPSKNVGGKTKEKQNVRHQDFRDCQAWNLGSRNKRKRELCQPDTQVGGRKIHWRENAGGGVLAGIREE